MHAPSSEISVDDEERGSSPPGSSRRAGGYSPVLRLTAGEMRPPLFPCPKKFTFWDTTLLPRGTFWVRGRAGPLADAPRPFSSCSPAAPRRMLHPGGRCGTGELINYKETNDPEVPISWL